MENCKCKGCGSTNFEENHQPAGLICKTCGALNEEAFITSSLNFTETNGVSQLNGEIIRMTDTYAKVGGSIIRSTNFQIQNQIKTICNSLGLSEEIALTAFRWYKLSLQANLTRGRSILYTLSACIYIVCRQEKTPHLLADFAHLLELDVFKIGNIFMKIVMYLNIKVPLIDPSLFLNRFFQKLKFKNSEILSFSMRLIARMKRDWIVVGRRPNNLCGAALVTASRVFNEEKSVIEVSKVVKVSPATINIRLTEMCDTQSANLSIKDFSNIWLEKEEDPPITKSKNKLNDEKIIETGILTPLTESHEDLLSFDDDFLETCVNSDESIDSNEINEFILTEDESHAKENIWNAMYNDFLTERSQKVKFKKKESHKRKPKEIYETVEDALKGVLKDKRMTNKINYEALKDLFD